MKRRAVGGPRPFWSARGACGPRGPGHRRHTVHRRCVSCETVRIGHASGVAVRVSEACYRDPNWTGKLRGTEEIREIPEGPV